jgi:hypothetical protein
MTLGPIQTPVPSVVGPFPGGKVAEVGVNHTPPSRSEFQNEWTSTSTHPTCLYGVYRDDFIFTYLLGFYLNFLHPRFNERLQFVTHTNLFHGGGGFLKIYKPLALYPKFFCSSFLGAFNCGFSNSEYIASNVGITDERWNANNLEGTGEKREKPQFNETPRR